jgi:hypothetical protein
MNRGRITSCSSCRPDASRERATGVVGLGLYLSRLIAQAHGAAFKVRNASPGLKVALRFTLELAFGPIASVYPASNSARPGIVLRD